MKKNYLKKFCRPHYFIRAVGARPARRGFTLIEMLVYMAIIVVVISVIVALGITAIRTGIKVKANAEVLGQIRDIKAFYGIQEQCLETLLRADGTLPA